MEDRTLLPETFAVLSKAFDLAEGTPHPVLAERVTFEEVKQFLTEHITRLLDRNPALLMSILYRVDVAEADVKRVLAEAPPGALPAALADLLIARQLQKIRIRRSYQGE